MMPRIVTYDEAGGAVPRLAVKCAFSFDLREDGFSLRVKTAKNWEVRVGPLRSPGFPVEPGGVGEHHAPFYAEGRKRSHV